MIIREAEIEDITQIQFVRNSVKENTLSDSNLVSDKDCVEYLKKRGKGWVCEINNVIVGFSVIDLKENNIWALFVHPNFENRGIGRELHDIMIDWYFSKSQETLWFGTSPNTRAEIFYRKSGWRETGTYGNEIKFEMALENWNKKKK